MNKAPLDDGQTMDDEDKLILESYEAYVNSLEKLPKCDHVKDETEPLDPDETSDDEDKILLELFQDYASELEEWPKFDYEKDRIDERTTVPLLIMECNRLIPIKNKKTGYLDFHPFNMPSVRLNRMNLIGMVLNTKEHQNTLQMSIYDGSGTMTVFFYPSRFKDDCPKKFVAEKSAMKKKLLYQTTSGAKENKNENWPEQQMTRIPLKIGDYVDIEGFCMISKHDTRNVKDLNYWRNGKMPVMLFNAYKVVRITEEKYNEKMEFWLTNEIKRRYE